MLDILHTRVTDLTEGRVPELIILLSGYGRKGIMARMFFRESGFDGTASSMTYGSGLKSQFHMHFQLVLEILESVDHPLIERLANLDLDALVATAREAERLYGNASVDSDGMLRILSEKYWIRDYSNDLLINGYVLI